MDSADIGKSIRAARTAALLSQSALAEAADLSIETISRIERGAYEPSVSTVVAIADALQLDLDVLIGRRPRGPIRKGRNRSAVGPGGAVVEALGRLDADARRLLIRLARRLSNPSRGKSPKRR